MADSENTSLISIIVPVYNAAQYIRKCVQSVIAQDYSAWELILVDDGSKDDSFGICQELAGVDSRIIAIHQDNGGANSARLKGYQHAHGDYITFLDSDDTFTPVALSSLLAAMDGDTDIVRGAMVNVNEAGDVVGKENFSVPGNLIQGKENYQVALFRDKVPAYLCGGLYKASLFSDEAFQKAIDYKLCIGEDFVTNVYVSRNVRQVRFIDTVTYEYFTNVNAAMNTSVIGREYCQRADESIAEFLETAAPTVVLQATVKIVIGIIELFYIPEIPYCHADYKRVKDYMRDTEIARGVREMARKRQLMFLNCEPLYYIYSRIYCLAFKYKKLKGRTRRVRY